MLLLDAEAGGKRPSEVVPWNQVVPKKELRGQMLRVECVGKNARLRVKDTHNRESTLLLRNASEAGLSCGDQKPSHSRTVTYSAQPDEVVADGRNGR